MLLNAWQLASLFQDQLLLQESLQCKSQTKSTPKAGEWRSVCVSSFLFLSFPFLVRMSSNNFIQVAEEEGDEPIELPTEEADNSLLITTLAAQFPGACGLKYRNPESRAWRGVRLSDGRLFPPLDTGWGGHVYISVMPKGRLNESWWNVIRHQLKKRTIFQPFFLALFQFFKHKQYFCLFKCICAWHISRAALTTMKSDIWSMI